MSSEITPPTTRMSGDHSQQNPSTSSIFNQSLIDNTADISSGRNGGRLPQVGDAKEDADVTIQIGDEDRNGVSERPSTSGQQTAFTLSQVNQTKPESGNGALFNHHGPYETPVTVAAREDRGGNYRPIGIFDDTPGSDTAGGDVSSPQRSSSSEKVPANGGGPSASEFRSAGGAASEFRLPMITKFKRAFLKVYSYVFLLGIPSFYFSHGEDAELPVYHRPNPLMPSTRISFLGNVDEATAPSSPNTAVTQSLGLAGPYARDNALPSQTHGGKRVITTDKSKQYFRFPDALPPQIQGKEEPKQTSEEHSSEEQWKQYNTVIIKQWETLNVVSALLLGSLLTIIRFQEVAYNPVIRTFGVLSLISALMSILFGGVCIVLFYEMAKKPYAIRWLAKSLQKKDPEVKSLGNVASLPVVWIAWSLAFFFVVVLGFVWNSGTGTYATPPTNNESGSTILWPRVTITIWFSLGVVNLAIIPCTYRGWLNEAGSSSPKPTALNTRPSTNKPKEGLVKEQRDARDTFKAQIKGPNHTTGRPALIFHLDADVPARGTAIENHAIPDKPKEEKHSPRLNISPFTGNKRGPDVERGLPTSH